MVMTTLVLSALALLPSPNGEAAPHTFDPAARKLEWVSPIALENRARREEEARQLTDEFLDRCAEMLIVENSLPREEPYEDRIRNTRERTGITEEDHKRCLAIEGKYFHPRRGLYDEIYQWIVPDGSPREDDSVDTWKRNELRSFEHQYGTEVVARLERHVAGFAKASGSFPGSTVLIAELAIAPRIDVGATPEQRAIDAFQAIAERMASVAVFERFIQVRAKPRAEWAEAERAAGFQKLDVEMLVRLIAADDGHRRGAHWLATNRSVPARQLAAAWERYRARMIPPGVRVLRRACGGLRSQARNRGETTVGQRGSALAAAQPDNAMRVRPTSI